MTQARSAGRPMVEADGLVVSLGGRRIINEVSLDVRGNEALAIIGPNGSGKTTLLLALALLVKPASGSLRYFGRPAAEASVLSLRRRTAVVFQEALLLDTTVAANVAAGLRFRGVPGPERTLRVQEWLERFGVGHLARRGARALSGGEAQRVSLARAFAMKPEVLFLDEPFAALDAPTRQALTEDFQRVLRETRVAAVMVTHDRNEALTLGDRVAVLIEGNIRQIGTAQQVFGSPEDETVAAFVGVENILSGVVGAQTGGIASVAVGSSTIDVVSDLGPGQAVKVCLRPEDVTLSLPRDSGAASSARNNLRGQIQRVDPAGAQTRVVLECGFPLVALVTRRSCEDMGLTAGQMVTASFKASSAHLIPRR